MGAAFPSRPLRQPAPSGYRRLRAPGHLRAAGDHQVESEQGFHLHLEIRPARRAHRRKQGQRDSRKHVAVRAYSISSICIYSLISRKKITFQSAEGTQTSSSCLNLSSRKRSMLYRLFLYSARSAIISPTTLTNLKPCPEQADAKEIWGYWGCRSIMKWPSGVLVNIQVARLIVGPLPRGK